MGSKAARRRALGQHFLIPGGAPERMVAELGPRPGEAVLEIGPGRGVLTRELLRAGAEVLAVEMDPHLEEALRAARLGQRLRLLRADVLRVDLPELLSDTFGERPVRVLSSLPYSSGTAILERLCDAMPPISAALVLLQEEVVERVVAAPGSPTYGYLSVAVRSRCRARAGFRVRPGSFDPRPRVMSRTLWVEPLAALPIPAARRRQFLQLVGLLFRHRRKTIANNLRSAGLAPSVVETALAGADARSRPGEWDVLQLARLFHSLPAGALPVLE